MTTLPRSGVGIKSLPSFAASNSLPLDGSSVSGASSLGILASIVSTSDVDILRRDALNRRFSLQGTARALLPDWRVCDCLRVPIASLVSVLHHAEFRSASYGGLHTCGNVHVCPVCGAKVSERRTLEVNTGAAAWLDRAGGLVMATFTLRHAATDALVFLGDALNKAYRFIRSGNRWKLFAKRYGLVGSITAREYTHGSNGWHPHLHALLFVRGGLSYRELKELEAWLASAWASAVARLGASASLEHGVRCQLSKDGALAEYIAKAGKGWTVGHELSKANSKKARAGGRSVAQLLEAAGFGDELAGGLFVEYANYTYRKNALVWSPGLRKLLGLVEEEKSDEEIAAEELAEARVMVVFTRRQWYVVLANDLRSDVLLVAGAGDSLAVADFVRQFGIVLEPSQIDPDPQLLAE